MLITPDEKVITTARSPSLEGQFKDAVNVMKL
jgi:hypothetical protein